MSVSIGTKTVASISDASERQLGHWDRSGIVKPSARGAKGRGTRRGYTFEDLVAVIAVRELRRNRCPLQTIRKVIARLRADYPDMSNSKVLSRLTLQAHGRKVYVSTSQQEAYEVLSRQCVWSIAIGPIVEKAHAGLESRPLESVATVSVGGRQYHLLVTPDSEVGGYVAQCRELPGALEQGDTWDEAVANGKAAIQSVLDFLKRRSGAASRGNLVRAIS